MPVLFYGNRPGQDKIELCNENLKPLSTLFSQYRISGLAPYRSHPNSALFWYIRRDPRHIHSALSWHDTSMREQTVFIPGQLTHAETLLTARGFFRPVIPSAIIFRTRNPTEPYLYD